jgi:hypothetical protein
MFTGVLTALFQVVNFVSGSAFQKIVGSVTHVLDTSKIADTVKFSTATVAERDVVVARMQADSQAYQARVGLYRGMFWLQIVLLFAYIGPVWHTMLVFLDSCPLLPMVTWVHGFQVVRHVVGSWRVPALPGQYGGEECQIMALLLGIQTAAVGGFMYFLRK